MSLDFEITEYTRPRPENVFDAPVKALIEKGGLEEGLAVTVKLGELKLTTARTKLSEAAGNAGVRSRLVKDKTDDTQITFFLTERKTKDEGQGDAEESEDDAEE